MCTYVCMQGGNQPIHLATMNGCVDVVEYLVKEHGVSLNTAAIPVGDVPLLTDTLVSEHVNIIIIVYGKTFSGENFHGCDDFSLNCKSFPAKYGLVDWQYT